MLNKLISVSTAGRSFALAAAAFLQVASAAAADLFWDGPNTSPNCLVDGGDGTWDFATANWTSADGCVNRIATPLDTSYCFSNTSFSVTIPAAGLALPPNVTLNIGLSQEWNRPGPIDYSFSGGSLYLSGRSTLRLFYDTSSQPWHVALNLDTTISGPGSLVVTQALADQYADAPLYMNVLLPRANAYTGDTILASINLDLRWAAEHALGTGDIYLTEVYNPEILNKGFTTFHTINTPIHLDQPVHIVGDNFDHELPAALCKPRPLHPGGRRVLGLRKRSHSQHRSLHLRWRGVRSGVRCGHGGLPLFRAWMVAGTNHSHRAIGSAPPNRRDLP